MENKQTAVEWLFERLERMIPRTKLYDMDKKQYLEQAKTMEKEQIKDAYIDGCMGEMYELSATYTAEEYYNATYGK